MCTHTHTPTHPHTHAPAPAPTRTHAPTRAPAHASRACHPTTPPTMPANGLKMAYNAFFTYGAWQCSATDKKRLKTALFNPCPQ